MKTAKDLARQIRSIPARLKQESFKLPIVEASQHVHQSVGKNFDRQVNDKGEAWLPHGPVTVQLYGEHPLLIYTGEMLRAAKGGPGADVKLSHRHMHMGFSAQISARARLVSDGGPSYDARGWFTIPPRKFYYLHKDDKPALHKAVNEKLKPIMRRVIYGS